MHRWKENLSEIEILFTYSKNISILQFYEQFSRNGRNLTITAVQKTIQMDNNIFRENL